MKDFFVNQIMDATMVTAFPIAIITGLISFLSPCVLPLVPGYISYAAGMSKSRSKVLLGSILFISGFSFLFVSYGVLFGGIGSKILGHEKIITQVLGIFTIGLGLVFMGRFPLMRSFKPSISTTGGLLGAPLLGFLFGIGWTPCIGPALAAVETLAFEQASAARGAVLSFGYCIGLGIPFILSGLFLDRSMRLRAFISRRGNLISQIGGWMLIAIGVLQVLGIWNDVMNSLRSTISGFIPVV
ncbi:MAG: cytochrome c biogenesis CcdA family protein [Actinobacteria bacterium]|nr:cytochrome c biogenesis CcdA family protein [Actinomycetota bacterium]